MVEQDLKTDDLPPQYHRGKLLAAGATIFLLLIILVSFFACGNPKQGTILYGICSTFLEQHVTYPEVIQRDRVEQYPRGVRIYYSQIDSFGQHREDMIECAFQKNEQGQIFLESVLMNREEISQEVLDKFNPTIPIIISAEPNLNLPWPKPDIDLQLRGGGTN